MKRFYKYIEDVKNGKVLTGKLIKLAVKRFEDDIKKGIFVFDEKEAQRRIDLIEHIKLWKGYKAGQKIILEDWQVFYFGQLFGWKDKKGFRRFRKSYLEVARKNGKTSLAAAETISHIMQDGEVGGQAYFVATKEDQARIGFEDFQKFAENTPLINKYFEHFKKASVYKMSSIKPLGSDSKTQDGLDPSLGIIDEYHAHKDSSMLDIIESGMGARQQPLISIITTAGFNQSSPCFNFRKMIVDILEGNIEDDSIFGLIYTLDEDDDWKDPDLWIKSNPNLNVSVFPEYIEKRIKEAINLGGSKETDVKTKNLNIWTDADDVWISSEILERNLKINTEGLEGQKCYGGLDLAKGVDLNAFVLYFPDTGDIIPYFWIPEDKVKNNRDGVDYSLWVQKGDIIEMEGNIIDYKKIKYDIQEALNKYNIVSIAYDRYIAHHGLIQDLLEDGVDVLNPMGQGFVSMNTPTKELEKLLTQGALKINNDVLKWMFGNAIVNIDPAGNIKPDKKKSIKKIDGVVALVEAIGEFMADEASGGGSIYDNDLEDYSV